MDKDYLKFSQDLLDCLKFIRNIECPRRIHSDGPVIDPITLAIPKDCVSVIDSYNYSYGIYFDRCCPTPYGIIKRSYPSNNEEIQQIKPELNFSENSSVKSSEIPISKPSISVDKEPTIIKDFSNSRPKFRDEVLTDLPPICSDFPNNRWCITEFERHGTCPTLETPWFCNVPKRCFKNNITTDSIATTVSENTIISDLPEVVSTDIIPTESATLLEENIDQSLVYIFTEIFPIERLSGEIPFYNVNNFSGIFFEIFLIFSVSLFLLYLVCIDYKFKYKLYLTTVASNLFIFILILSFLVLNNTLINYYVFDYLIIQDNLGFFVKNILILSLLFCIIISRKYIKIEKLTHYEYFLLISLSLIGIITMITANDLATIYIGIELQSLAFYLLAAFKVYSNFSTEAGLKYFILGAFSSGLLLFGCSLIYGFTGTTNLLELHLIFFNKDIPDDIFNGILLGNIFITIGILFKLGAAPFHMWLPDVYDGAPTSVTALFSIVPKIAIFTLFIRLTINLFCSTFFFWHQLLVYTALLSIVIGTFGALYQVKIKKLLAYSAISHVGFLLIGFISYNILGFFALFFYIIVYILISLNFFAIILNVRKLDNNLKLKKINEYVLLFKSNKLLAINFSILLFSIAGIPPLLGFFSKLYVFKSAIHADLYLVTIIAAISSVIACLYYIRLIKLLFFKRFDYWLFLYEIPKATSMLISITLVLNILFFFYPELFTIYIYNNILQFFIQNNLW